jgi:hypothetical protein
MGFPLAELPLSAPKKIRLKWMQLDSGKAFSNGSVTSEKQSSSIRMVKCEVDI